MTQIVSRSVAFTTLGVATLFALIFACAIFSGCAKPDAHVIQMGNALKDEPLAPDANAKDDEWKGAKVTHAEPPAGMMVAPPMGSFGFEGCGRFAIWVFLADGSSYRIDSEHSPKTAADMRKLLDWLNQGPTDIVKYEQKDCGTGV